MDQKPKPPLTPHQSQYIAWRLTRQTAGDTVESFASTLVDSQVDLNPHQVDAAFRGVTAAQAAERWPNLTLKKIPRMVLARCEGGHDDYSLNVANLPLAEPSPPAPLPQAGEGSKSPASAGRRGRKATATPDMFGDAE